MREGFLLAEVAGTLHLSRDWRQWPCRR